MRRALLTVIAIAAFVSSGILLHHAAVKVHTPPVTDAKAADNGLLRFAANVCAMNGCVAVQVKRLDRHQIQKLAPKSLQQYMQQTPARTAS